MSLGTFEKTNKDNCSFYDNMKCGNQILSQNPVAETLEIFEKKNLIVFD